MKARIITASGAALSLTAALTLSVGAAPAASASARPGPHAPACRTLAGHEFTESTDIGFSESYAYNAADTEVTATVIDGDAFGLPDGSVYTEEVSVAEIEPGVYMVSWVEPGGYTVSQVQDLRDGKVQLYWTFPDGQGDQIGQQHTGTISCLRS